MINWNIPKADHDLIVAIAKRAFVEFPDYPDTQAALMMDLTAAHANGCPLNLHGLLDFASFDFAHDIYGIRRHINRKTGELENSFCPRCAAPLKASA